MNKISVGGEDEVRLDEEMERVVWADAAPRLPAAAAEPRRDSAAPPPYSHQPGGASANVALCADGASAPGSSEQPAAAAPRDAAADARHVQFDGARAPHADALDDADDERRAQRSMRVPTQVGHNRRARERCAWSLYRPREWLMLCSLGSQLADLVHVRRRGAQQRLPSAEVARLLVVGQK
ncbi:hypothetical protein PYW08_000674 [Mythimna loreyi]|uniref:Uncharacterized protein n=1 Tax=Mythimna loreyi TaxID=667449 RepID=A0ACC2RD59_9NEOP|nr:hypothetical protein PYW08_000674 [Mythimna loreyi]